MCSSDLLVIRLLVTAHSPLLELADIKAAVADYDPDSLTWPWRHRDPRVDALQDAAMRVVGTARGASRRETFAALMELARGAAGLPPEHPAIAEGPRAAYMDEPWYCCAEPAADDLKFI